MAKLIKVDGIQVENRLKIDSLTIESGKFTALIGPNGAGKSTLLTELNRRLIKKLGASQVCWLEQRASPAWPISIGELVALGRLAHKDRNKQAIGDALGIMQLTDIKDRAFDQVSGGQQARALIARCLATRPRWLLLDEPLASLDPGHQLHLLAHLKALSNEGVGVIVAMHDLALAAQYCDTAVILNEGALASNMPASQLLASDIVGDVFNVSFDNNQMQLIDYNKY